ncbi:MAG TPA: hypothetical protein VJ770_18955 [Stellaceae bacterium]|nr:hypothetical protein [Stellaceae bacterium]
MDEILPVVLAFALGIVIWRYTNGRTRLILSGCAVALSGLAATVLSGEFHQSWVFLLLDLGEAAFGLAIGCAAAHRLLSPGAAGGRRSETSAKPRSAGPRS